MTSRALLFAFLTFTFVSAVCRCKAEGLAPPSNVSYRWIDAFTVNVSWLKPRAPLQDVKYKYRLQDPNSLVRSSLWRNFTVDLLTEEKGSGSWTYLVWTSRTIGGISEESAKESITIETPKPRAQVTDIKCLVVQEKDETNCSWVPGNQDLTLSFRVLGRTNVTDVALKGCERPYGDGVRSGCYLNADGVKTDVYMLFLSDAGLSTFKLTPMIDPPELSIGEEGDELKLSWTCPKIIKENTRIFTVCYKRCSQAEVCLDYTTTGESMLMSYEKSCRYEFRSRVRTSPYTIPIFSEFGQNVSYGEDEPADKTLTVVAIVVPVILSVCILLSCYCFRRHRSILWPVIPHPTLMFKEVIMNGSKELKTTAGTLYTPVPEPVDSWKVDSVTDGGGGADVVPLNS